MSASDPKALTRGSPSRLEWIDRLCDTFEAAWQEGHRPPIEAYLAAAAEPERTQLLEELLKLELEYRHRNNEPIDTADYRRRFPTHAKVIEAVVATTAPPVAPETATPELAVPGTLATSGSTIPRAESRHVAIPGYEIVQELGSGGMGIVYKARQVALNRPAALKVIKSGTAAGREELRRFRAEAKVIALLQHPHIVQIYEVGEHHGQPYLALELIEGSNLHERLKGAPLPAREAAQLVVILARTMQVAHERGVVHRDLKPANVLLTADGTPKITDFGLAKHIDIEAGQTASGAVMGTPSYMPPEQARGHTRQIGPPADVYALGALLYEVLTGRPPFMAATTYETLGLVVTAEPLPPRRLQPAVPRDLDTICLKCLQKEPAKRYASAQALAEDLDRFLADKPIHARRTPAWERAFKWVRRRPAVAALVVVSIAATLALFVAVLAAMRAELVQARTRAKETERLYRHQAEALRLKGQADATQDDTEKARNLASALAVLEDEPSLRDLHAQLETALVTVTERLAQHEQWQQGERVYRQFVERRDEALTYAILYSGADTMSLARAKDKAQRALALFEVAGDSPSPPHFRGPYFDSSAKKKEIIESCYELLLILAEAVAHAVPGQAKETYRTQLAMAIQILDRAQKLCPPTRAHHLRYARYLFQLGDAKQAQRELQRAAESEPVTSLDYFLMGDEHARQGELQEAVAAFEAALHRQPDHFWSEFFVAMCHLRSRPQRLAEAKTALTACLARRKDLVWVYLNRGLVYTMLNEFAEAEDDYQKALQLFEGRRDADAEYALLANRAFLRYRQERLTEAVTDYQRAIERRPDQYLTYVNLAEVYRKQHKWNEALIQLDQAIRLKPTDLAGVYRTRAQLYLEQRNAEAALRDFERALKAYPPGANRSEMATVHADSGDVLYRLGRYQEALSAYDAALRINATLPSVYRSRAQALLRLQRYREAEVSLERSIERGRHVQPELLSLLSCTPMAGLGGVPWASLVLSSRRNAALKLAANGYWACGRVRFVLKNYAGAIEDYTRALALVPDSVTYLERGWSYLLSEAPKLALHDFEEALLINRDNAEAYNGRAHARMRLGQYQLAVEDASTLLRLKPKVPRLVYSAARIYAQAVAKAEADRRRPRRGELARDYQDRAVLLLRKTLDLLPARQRGRFWREKIMADRSLYPIHGSTGFLQLATDYRRAAQ
jgi:tetratricopeptide (TPR) repeat protein